MFLSYQKAFLCMVPVRSFVTVCIAPSHTVPCITGHNLISLGPANVFTRISC